MKKINHYVLNGAIALLSTAGFVACSSSDDVTDAPVNPTYDGKSVKTQFAINIASASKTSTRMTADNTQASGSQFLGMKNIYLLPINGVPSTSSVISKAIPLDNVTNSNSIGTSDALSSSKSSTVYSDVNVPVGTDNFLFYGTSPMGTTPNEKFNQGFISNNLTSATTVDKIQFDLEKISRSGLATPKSSLITWLKSIADAKAVIGSETNETNWASLPGTTPGDEETLKNAYSNFISLKAGSAAAILETVHRLYDVCYPISQGTGDYKELATAIINAIKGTDDCGVSYTAPTVSASASTLEWKNSVPTTVKEFPTYQDFPDGSMVLTWSTATPAVPSYVSETQSATTGQNNMNVSKLCYPAPVAYYANTPLRSSDSNSQFSWPATTTNWDVNNNWIEFSDNVVRSTTRKIALRNNINYGVASLQTTVICNEPTLLDHDNVAINVTKDNGLPVTGIIIGGQPESVKWNYVTTETQNEGIIYDKNVVSGMRAISDGSTPTVNYTLVFDNYVSAAADNQESVSIAIELVNNTGVDFKGKDGNIVAADQKFYLVGKLEIAGKTLTGWPVNYDTDENHTEGYLYESYKDRYPVENNILRVFIQDYTTVAKFTIKDLKNAYVTIPDLRASKLQLGLSVDLEWKTGLTYDVDL
ncbi:MAG: hypothetical protein SO188_12125 [Prevotella sp.]|nr:hypothetical protein [Prevotella sp.]